MFFSKKLKIKRLRSQLASMPPYFNDVTLHASEYYTSYWIITNWTCFIKSCCLGTDLLFSKQYRGHNKTLKKRGVEYIGPMQVLPEDNRIKVSQCSIVEKTSSKRKPSTVAIRKNKSYVQFSCNSKIIQLSEMHISKSFQNISKRSN